MSEEASLKLSSYERVRGRFLRRESLHSSLPHSDYAQTTTLPTSSLTLPASSIASIERILAASSTLSGSSTAREERRKKRSSRVNPCLDTCASDGTITGVSSNNLHASSASARHASSASARVSAASTASSRVRADEAERELLLELRLAMGYECRLMGSAGLLEAEAQAVAAGQSCDVRAILQSELHRLQLLQEALSTESNVVEKDHFALDDLGNILNNSAINALESTVTSPQAVLELLARLGGLRSMALLLSLQRARYLIRCKDAELLSQHEHFECEGEADRRRVQEQARTLRELSIANERMQEETAYLRGLPLRISDLEDELAHAKYELERLRNRTRTRIEEDATELRAVLDLPCDALLSLPISTLSTSMAQAESISSRLRQALLQRTSRTEEALEKVRADMSSTCCICCEGGREILLLPCKHLCVCEPCARVAVLSRCPMCRETVQQTIKVFS